MNKQQELCSRTEEIADRLMKGTNTHELINEYTQKWDCGQRTVERYIAMAKDKVFGEIKNKDSIMNAIRTDSVMELFEHSMLSTYELEAKLCNIASGTVKMQKLVVTERGTDIMNCYPSPAEQLKAINLLLRLRGKLLRPEGWENGNNTEVKVIIRSPEDEELIAKVKVKE